MSNVRCKTMNSFVLVWTSSNRRENMVCNKWYTVNINTQDQEAFWWGTFGALRLIQTSKWRWCAIRQTRYFLTKRGTCETNSKTTYFQREQNGMLGRKTKNLAKSLKQSEEASLIASMRLTDNGVEPNSAKNLFKILRKQMLCNKRSKKSIKQNSERTISVFWYRSTSISFYPPAL